VGPSFSDFIPYLLIALTLFSLVVSFRQYQSRRRAATSQRFEELKTGADRVGNAARQKARTEADALFDEYENKDKKR
jgi:hypothetical protein